MFPQIETFDDIRDVVDSKEEIKVKDKGWYFAVDYTVQMKDTFDSAVARECRGIKFNRDGTVLARPFHKFFNRGEHPNLEPDHDPSQEGANDYEIQEKIDGSLVHTALDGTGFLVLMTKGGITDVSDQAQALFNTYDQKVFDLLAQRSSLRFTHMFEFVSPENRIVLHYDEPDLIYLGSRGKVSGNYLFFDDIAQVFGSARVYDENDVANIKDWVGHEGVVLVWPSGERLKVKADDYVLKHKTKDNINQEKNALKLVLDDSVDDLADILDAEDYNKVVVYRDTVTSNMMRVAEDIEAIVEENKHRERADLRKNFVPTLNKEYQDLFWKVLNGNDAFDTVKKALENSTTKQKKIDEHRALVGTTWHGVLGDE